MERPGWTGAFTCNSVPGAIPNGRQIVKINEEEGDANPLGTPGVVLGSISHPDVMDGAICYFVEWATMPRVACAVLHWKIEEVR